MRRVISLCLGAGATGPVQQQPLLHLLLPVSTQIVTAAARRAHHQTAAPPLLHRTLSRSESPNRTQSNIGLLSTSAQTFTTATRWTSRQPHSLSTPARRFSTSTSQRGTQAVFNPQDDETGQAMVVEITPRAATRLTQIMTKDSNPQLALRIQVESGGCHGFQYIMKLVTLPSEVPSVESLRQLEEQQEQEERTASSTPVLRSDDTIFVFAADENMAGDAVVGLEGPKIVLDTASLELLKGSKVDFTQELIGSQFKIVDNPFATSSCGCGTSFDIKA